MIVNFLDKKENFERRRRITEDKRLTSFAQIVFGNFFYPQNVI